MTHLNKKWLKSLLYLALLMGCQPEPDAEKIVNEAIEQHGGSKINHINIEFDFRDIHYSIWHKDGLFQYERSFIKDSVKVHDILTNDGFQRFIQGQKVDLSQEWIQRYSSSVNSVVYFALLPFKLSDPAVNKILLGTDSVENEPYFEIKVTFDKQGGGDDHEDEFIYWIHQDKYTMDYLAYLYYDDGGGRRFRKAYNQKLVEGIIFQDYYNFAGVEGIPLQKLDSLYEQGKLEMVSDIRTRNLKVTLNPEFPDKINTFQDVTSAYLIK